MDKIVDRSARSQSILIRYVNMVAKSIFKKFGLEISFNGHSNLFVLVNQEKGIFFVKRNISII
jgi:hypothetical protein